MMFHSILKCLSEWANTQESLTLGISALSCPTVGVTSAGADGGTPSERKMLRQRNRLKNAQTPQRRVHALLGVFALRKIT